MGEKVKLVGLIIGAVIIAYLFLTATMPVISDFASTANTTISSTSNMSDYPGTQGALLAAPFWLYFVPAIIGIAAIVFALKRRE